MIRVASPLLPTPDGAYYHVRVEGLMGEQEDFFLTPGDLALLRKRQGARRAETTVPALYMGGWRGFVLRLRRFFRLYGE